MRTFFRNLFNTRRKIFITVLVVLGFLTRFAFFGYPNSVVFDEHYYGADAADYMSGHYFYDLHPPLAKLLITIPAVIVHARPTEKMFAVIDTVYPNSSYLSLRFLPGVAGSLLPVLLFFVALELGFSDTAAFLAGLLSVFETSLLTESRFILIDIFIVIFGFLGFFIYLRYRKQKQSSEKNILLLASLILFGCAVSVKWTGLSFLGIAGLIEIADLYRNREYISHWLKHFFAFLLIPLFVYVSIFAVHMYVLNTSGTGDAFMSPSFQKTLIGSKYQFDPSIKPEPLWIKIFESNMVSFDVHNQPQFSHHPYNSQWYTWPLMLRPIYYWYDTASTTNSTHSRIYLFGNPAVYWLSSLAILVLLFLLISKKVTKGKREAVYILLLGYAANWLPFVFISRGMFLYHYLSALVFAILVLAFVFDCIPPGRARDFVLIFILTAVIMAFFYFAPLAYGLPLSDHAYSARLWLKSWL